MNQAVAVRDGFGARARRRAKLLVNPRYLRHEFRNRVIKTRGGINTVHDYVTDRKYGGRCGGTYSGQWGDQGYRGTSSAHYAFLARIFSPSNITVGPDDVLVDIGSGKGRVLNFWLEQGYPNRLIGCEIDPRFADFSAHRLAAWGNVEIQCGDVFENFPADGTIYYLFNPFNEAVMARFKEAVEATHGPEHPATVVYYMCNSREMYERDPAWKVTPVRQKTFHPAIIARYGD